MPPQGKYYKYNHKELSHKNRSNVFTPVIFSPSQSSSEPSVQSGIPLHLYEYGIHFPSDAH